MDGKEREGQGKNEKAVCLQSEHSFITSCVKPSVPRYNVQKLVLLFIHLHTLTHTHTHTHTWPQHLGVPMCRQEEGMTACLTHLFSLPLTGGCPKSQYPASVCVCVCVCVCGFAFASGCVRVYACTSVAERHPPAGL